MLTKIEKLMILIDLLNELPNVEYKMKGISIRGLDNISKSKVIKDFGEETHNSLLCLPSMTEILLSDRLSMIHYTIFGKQVLAVKRRK